MCIRDRVVVVVVVVLIVVAILILVVVVVGRSTTTIDMKPGSAGSFVYTWVCAAPAHTAERTCVNLLKGLSEKH